MNKFLSALSVILFIICVTAVSCTHKHTDERPDSSSTVIPTTSTATPVLTSSTKLPFIPSNINVNYILISPDTVTLSPGGTQEFTAMAYLHNGDSFDITHETSFTIERGAGGEWLYNKYISENPGTWKVTGSFQHPSDGCIAWSDSAEITVTLPETAVTG